MDRVGGYLGLLALREDVLAYEDVLLAMAGEADAHRIQRMKAEMQRV